jgi:hypothetical protein
MSINQVKDGFVNCLNEKDERNHAEKMISSSCLHVRRHRFRCLMSQPTCLCIMALGNEKKDCENRFNELWFDTNQKFSQMNCNHQCKGDCFLLYLYIGQSFRKKRL